MLQPVGIIALLVIETIVGTPALRTCQCTVNGRLRTIEEKAQLIETLEVKERIRKVLRLLTRQLEILKMRERINSQIKEEMGKNQREYVLRQQLKAIKEELGEDDGDQGDLDGLEERIAKAELPQEADQVAKKQLKRLRTMQVGSAEYTVVRTYLDWILDVPWSASTEDNLEILEVRRVLDEDHYGLEKVKKRIVEYLAVRKLKKDKKGPILCLLGPPGVGKTSLGKSIARALGRKFVGVAPGAACIQSAWTKMSLCIGLAPMALRSIKVPCPTRLPVPTTLPVLLELSLDRPEEVFAHQPGDFDEDLIFRGCIDP